MARRVLSKILNGPIIHGVSLYDNIKGYEWTTCFPEYGIMLGGTPRKGFFAANHETICGVINMCDESHDETDLEILNLPTIDSKEPTLQYLQQAMQFIETCLQNNPQKFVYIHCRAGVSRSAEICVAWLCYKFSKTPVEAYQILHAKRPQVKPKCYNRPNIIEFCSQNVS